MNASMSKLRLGPLPKTETVKITLAIPVVLKADLDRYAALHAKTYGEPVQAATLIPLMLETFITRDRSFRAHKHKVPNSRAESSG
jgi:hypothetical protein